MVFFRATYNPYFRNVMIGSSSVIQWDFAHDTDNGYTVLTEYLELSDGISSALYLLDGTS
jgi:hypothetical protein